VILINEAFAENVCQAYQPFHELFPTGKKETISLQTVIKILWWLVGVLLP